MTLIEVMLAMAILAIGMVVLLAAASRCMAVIKGSSVYQDARMLLARVELENPLILEEEIQEGSDGGYFTGEYRNYKWSRDIVMVGEEEEDGLFEVTTTISWSDRSRRGRESVVTYFYFPPDEDDLQK